VLRTEKPGCEDRLLEPEVRDRANVEEVPFEQQVGREVRPPDNGQNRDPTLAPAEDETASCTEGSVVHVGLDDEEVWARRRSDRGDQRDNASFTPRQEPVAGARVGLLQLGHSFAPVYAAIEEDVVGR